MALATKPKPSAQYRKRRAQHHRRSKSYVKAYWPYLPMLIIVGIGTIINKLWSTGGFTSATSGLTSSAQSGAAQPLTRVQTLAGNQAGGLLAMITLITIAAFVLFTIRHWYRLHRLINKGEAFISQHPWLDIATVFVFTVGFVLTRFSGIG